MTAGRDILGAAIVECFLQHGAELRVSDTGELQAIFPEPGIGWRPIERAPLMRGDTDGSRSKPVTSGAADIATR